MPAPISFEDYALVSAGLADGLELSQLLDHCGLDGMSWLEGERHWREKVAADSDNLEGLGDELVAEQMRARQLWNRPIPPLDEALDDWIHFQRQLVEQPDPLAYLDELRILPSDLARLADRWQQRMHDDRSLLERLAAILNEPPRRVDVAPLAPPRLPDAAAAASAEPAPATLPRLDAPDGPPPLSMPLPTLEDTADPVDEPGYRDPVLPFVVSPRSRPRPRPVVADSALPFRPPSSRNRT
jgi:hypothetical protein